MDEVEYDFAQSCDDELGPFDCDSCDLSFYVIAYNDAEIMDHGGGLQIHYCPRCGTSGVQSGLDERAERA